MTIEKAQKDFIELIEKNGFTEVAKTTDTQNVVYHRERTREGRSHGMASSRTHLKFARCSAGRRCSFPL